MTKIIRCTCEHDYQDKKHGKGKRVGNKIAKDGNYYRCTVCIKEHSA